MYVYPRYNYNCVGLQTWHYSCLPSIVSQLPPYGESLPKRNTRKSGNALTLYSFARSLLAVASTRAKGIGVERLFNFLAAFS